MYSFPCIFLLMHLIFFFLTYKIIILGPFIFDLEKLIKPLFCIIIFILCIDVMCGYFIWINYPDIFVYINNNPSGNSGGSSNPGGSPNPGGPNNPGPGESHLLIGKGLPRDDSNNTLDSETSYSSNDIKQAVNLDLNNIKNTLKDPNLSQDEKNTRVVEYCAKLGQDLVNAKREIINLKSNKTGFITIANDSTNNNG